ncbi:MAG: transglutaminase family protein [Phycisphaerales bacterium]|nr:transglutaminase family protein [Phycisphaerales bacterium]
MIAAISAAMLAAATLVQAPSAPPPGAAPATPAPPASGPATFSTISGRPPELPARRVEPRIWEIAFEADIWAPQTPGARGAPLNFGGVVAWMPLVLQSTYSAMDAQSIRAETWVDGRRVAVPVASLQMRQGLSQGMSAVGIQMPPAGVQGIKWKVSWKVQCWSSVVDERAAAAITWPAEWPVEAQESLQAAPGFEVGHPDMKAFVDRSTGGKLRSVTPWIAAKELVRATCTTFRGLDEDGVRVENGFPRGLVFNGAHAAMSARTGSGPDLVAACVTVLRTAGIPARAVLGAAEVMNSSGTNSRARLTCWAELWLPGAGWVPFSPVDLVGSIRGGLNVERPWKNFGTWDGLNESIPLCYGWALPMQGCHSLPYPAGYVLNARIAPDDVAQMRDRVTIQILGRGRGRD